MDAGEAALSWIGKLVVSNENNRNELKEALTLINSYRTLADIGRIGDLNNMLHVICLFVRDERELLDVEIRRIAKHIRTYRVCSSLNSNVSKFAIGRPVVFTRRPPRSPTNLLLTPQANCGS